MPSSAIHATVATRLGMRAAPPRRPKVTSPSFARQISRVPPSRAPVRPRRLGDERILTRRGDERRELALVHRDVDELPAPAALARVERHRDARRRLGPRGVVGGRQRAAHRRAVGVAGERRVAAHRDEHEVVRAEAGPGPRAAEGRERAPDQARQLRRGASPSRGRAPRAPRAPPSRARRRRARRGGGRARARAASRAPA